MKAIFATFIILLGSIILYGQAPGMFKYQAVVRNEKGKIMDSQNISVQIDIVKDSPSGASVFTETQNVFSTEQGLINLNIGSVNTTGLSSINWASHAFFIRITINGVFMGASQLLSVPYALFAQTSGSSLPGPQGEKGIQGEKGEVGAEGKSAYLVWLSAGNTGSQTDFINSLKGAKGDQGEKGNTGQNGIDGKSAYQIWLDAGNTGTPSQFIAFLKGDKGDPGATGSEGRSAYQVWLSAGNTGSQTDFINALKGAKGDQGEKGNTGQNGIDGKSAYQIWLDAGNTGTPSQFIAFLKGDKGDPGATGSEGKSAYQVWLSAGNTGSQTDFINSLKGTKGDNGSIPGHEWSNTSLRFENPDRTWGALVNLKGDKGDKGETGTNGKSSYQVWLEAGNTGTQAEFIASLKGSKGDTGLSPGHEWNGTSLRFMNPDGTWGNSVNLKGATGEKGNTGATGPQGLQGNAPEHQWTNTSLRFKNPDGSWGAYVDLKGTPGPSVKTFAVCSDALIKNYEMYGFGGHSTWDCESAICRCENGVLLSEMNGNCQVSSETGICSAKSVADSDGKLCYGRCCVCMAK